MPSFGEELKQAREERGISLRQIADATHIGIRFLQAIESDNYSTLPGGIFNRSFVKNYARYIGLDEEQALARYNQQLEEQGGEPPRVPAARFEGIEDDEPSSWGSISLIILILVIVGLGGYGVYRYLKGKSTDSANPPAVQSQAPGSVPSPAATETPQPSLAPAAAAAASPSPEASAPAANVPPDALRVKLQARDQECWTKVKTDEKQPEIVTLKPGETREYIATQKLVLNLGNMQFLNVMLNGRLAKLPTKANGTVAENIIITKDNYQTFIQ